MNLPGHIRGEMKRLAFGLAGIAIVAVCTQTGLWSRDKNVRFVPELQKEQVVLYEIHGRVQRQVKTESRVSTILKPAQEKQDYSGQLRMKIKETGTENGRPVVNARAEFIYPVDPADANASAEKHFIDFTIGGNGQVRNLTGFDDLEPVERMAWQFWVSRFAFGWTLPAEELKRGEKWKNEEAESNPAPIARLVWERATTYGENGKCAVIPAETCAVFFTDAVLKQKSSMKDSTPEDYRLHDLVTSGTATGTNEMYTAISQTTGLVLRGTEDVRQSMNVVIAKADGSNGVKYSIEAASHFEMVLVAEGTGH
jgi:hypothetical protein